MVGRCATVCGVIATLPMYARPELEDAHARYWALIRSELDRAEIASPRELSLGIEEQVAWRHPDLVLSQTCGLPYRDELHGEVALVGTPDFGLDDCKPGHGRSAFAVRRDDQRSTVADFADAVFAFNQPHSESGYASAYRHVRELGFWFERRVGTGSHRASASALAEGTADIALIDAVTWRAIQRYEPHAASLRAIDWTAPTPWLPYITRADGPADALFDAVASAIDRLAPSDQDALSLYGFVRIPASEYLAVPNPPDEITANL